MVKAEGAGARWNLSVAQGLLTSQPGSLGRTFPYFISASEGGHAAAGPDGGRHGQMLLHSRARPGAGRTEQGRDAPGAEEASAVQERRVGGRGAPCSSPKALTHTGALCQSLGKTSAILLPFPNLSSSGA